MFGLRIIENPLMTIGPFEDWSRVRSPARARRRRSRHPQRITLFYKPSPHFFRLPDGSIVCHPDMARKLKEATK